MSSLVDLPCLKKISPKAPKKVSKSSSSSTTRRPRTSPIWAYATQDPNERITLNKDGQEVWICSLCTSKTTSYLLSGGTAAPIRHLLRIHHIQIPPSNSKNKRKSKSCLKSSIANQLAISNQHSISNQHHISSSQLSSSSSSSSNQSSTSSNPPKQLLPSPAIKSNPSNQQDSLSKTIAASMNNNSSNITNLATLNLNNYPIQDPSSNSALFDVLLKYDVPASAIPTPKFRAFCSIVNPDAVLAINSSDNHNTSDSLPSSSSSVNLDSLPSTSPSLSPTCPSSTSQTPYSLSKYIDSSYLTAPATPISSESIIINPASSQFIFPHNNTPQYTYFSPITPSTTSSSSSISSPESTFSPPQNIPLQTTTIISNPNASSDDGWYYPGLDSPITPISSASAASSSSSSVSINTPSSTSYFPFSPMTIPNIQYSNISCPNLYDQSANILIENPSQLVSFEKPMPIYQPSNYDVNFFTLVEW